MPVLTLSMVPKSVATLSVVVQEKTFLISTLSNAAIYGGADQDSVNITGSLCRTVDFETASLHATVGAANSTCGGGGNDTFVVASQTWRLL